MRDNSGEYLGHSGPNYVARKFVAGVLLGASIAGGVVGGEEIYDTYFDNNHQDQTDQDATRDIKGVETSVPAMPNDSPNRATTTVVVEQRMPEPVFKFEPPLGLREDILEARKIQGDLITLRGEFATLIGAKDGQNDDSKDESRTPTRSLEEIIGDYSAGYAKYDQLLHRRDVPADGIVGELERRAVEELASRQAETYEILTAAVKSSPGGVKANFGIEVRGGATRLYDNGESVSTFETFIVDQNNPANDGVLVNTRTTDADGKAIDSQWSDIFAAKDNEALDELLADWRALRGEISDDWGAFLVQDQTRYFGLEYSKSDFGLPPLLGDGICPHNINDIEDRFRTACNTP